MRAEAGEDAGGKPGSGGAILLVAALSQDLVHGAEREAATGQGAVDRGDSERQHAMPRRRWLFQPPEPVAEGGDVLRGGPVASATGG